MSSQWIKKRILITVKTYPIPSIKDVEVSCTAGITDDGEWIRIFPVPYRLLEAENRFEKYHWIEASVKKSSSDTRPESFKINPDSIKIISKISTGKDRQWLERRKTILQYESSSLCAITREQKNKGFPTLGIFKPQEIKNLIIKQSSDTWTSQQEICLKQQLLFKGDFLSTKLQKIPYDFSYKFNCSDNDCNGHTMICTDWEMGQAYRKWRKQYRFEWESKFKEKFERDMIEKFDTYFFVGTIHNYPGTWIIIGLFYPPKTSMLSLF